MQVQAANSGPAKYKGLTDVVLSLYRFSIRISIIAAIVLIITTIRIMLILTREGGLRSIFRGSAATAARGESFTFHNFFSFLHTIYKCASYLHGDVLLRVWSLHVHWLVWDFIFENGEELRSRKTVGGLLRKNSWTNLEAGWFFSCFFFKCIFKKMQCLWNLELAKRVGRLVSKMWGVARKEGGREEGGGEDGGASLPAQSKFGSSLKPLSSFH